MSSQQVLFAETIMAMKKALKRKAYESDSDTEIEHPGNRGHKLKKRARFAHEGQLAPPSGPEVYRETVNHAGYERVIISRNPPLLDDEGYEIDSDDDEGHIQDVIDTAAEFNPYARIQLEHILQPLTAVTDLPSHPTFSRPYTSKTLTELTNQACEIMHKENAALWKIKHLQTRLVGDHVWAPCELMLGPNDVELFREDDVERANLGKGSVQPDTSIHMQENSHGGSTMNGANTTNGDTSPRAEELVRDGADSADTTMIDAGSDAGTPTAGSPNPDEKTAHVGRKGNNDSDGQAPSKRQIDRNSKGETIPDSTSDMRTLKEGKDERSDTGMTNIPMTNGAATSNKRGGTAGSNEDLAQRRRDMEPGEKPAMSVLSGSSDDISIHPLFLAPRSAHPDRDLGIPEAEAEDMRRLMQLYVQKQEEVCRGAKRLYEGLLKADRQRKTVFQWTKYEAHAGLNRDMSDGEDWYDKEEWDLEEDLKKGQDEEEEDTAQPTKKTRTRR
ncbi:RXT2-like protein [Xylariomycetidae sp. FL2044]|nr:RXT2-like protein [Xylariomycetidae sp. FL2044]